MHHLVRQAPFLRRYLLVCGCLAALLASVRAAPQILPASPTPHYIRDDAKWLSPAAFQGLDAKLQAYERETSSQIVVAILPQIPEGEEIFDYSQRIFEAWKPGLKEKDNGAILFVFANDRKLRIHIGYGLEGVLPDARCKQIIENEITPRLKSGQREEAILAGVDAMIAATKGEYTGTGSTKLDHSRDGSGPNWIILLLFFVIAGLSFFNSLRGKNVIYGTGGSIGRGGWGGGGGGFSGGGGSSGGGGASGSW